MLAGQDRFEPFFHQLPAGPADRVDTCIQSPRDLAVTAAFAGLRGVGLQQDACPHQLLCGVLAHVDQCVEPLSLLIAKLHDIPLYGDLFRGHESSPSLRCGAIDSKIPRIVNDVRY